MQPLVYIISKFVYFLCLDVLTMMKVAPMSYSR